MIRNPKITVRLPQLEAGDYTWRVEALTFDNLDISSQKDFSFSVLPIPPLPPVRFISPINNKIFGARFFKSNRSIEFKWRKNKDATHYSIAIFDIENNPVFET